MTDYTKFMDDPDIINEPMPLREIHAIRFAIAEETKDLTVDQRVAYFNRHGEAAAKKYGFKIIASANSQT
ncbi:MAG: hypothetical protein LBT44_09795 [Clostridiales bacterium]|jgi:hypothetical protein|nr:hypothetical protein [Clostridiales bacterium]